MYGRTSDRVLRGILYFCACCYFALSSLAAVSPLAVRMRNDTASNVDFNIHQYSVRKNGVHVGTYLPSGSVAPGNLGASFSIAVAGFNAGDFLTMVRSSTNAVALADGSSYPPTDAYTFTISVSGTLIFSHGGTPPSTTWCFKATVKNNTAVPRSYTVYYNAPGGPIVTEAMIFLNPGASQDVEISDKDEKGYVSVEESGSNTQVYVGDGIWAPADSGRFFFSADPSSSGWYSCSGSDVLTPVTQAPLDLTALTNNNPLNLDMSTNLLTQSNYSLGISGVAQLLQAMIEKNQQNANNQSNILNEGFGNINNGLGLVNSNLGNVISNLVGLGTNLNGQGIEGHLSTNDLEAAGFPTLQQAINKGYEVSSNVTDQLTGLQGAYSSISNLVEDIPVSDPYWVVQLPALAQVGGPSEINFNPTVWGGFVNVAAWVKLCLAWLSCIILIRASATELIDTFRAMGSWQTGRSVKTAEEPLLWNKPNLIKKVTSTLFSHAKTFLILAGIMVTITAIVSTYFVNSGLYTQAQMNPFSSANTAIAQGLWLLTQFVPIDVFFFHIAIYGSFRFALMIWIMATQMALRYIPTSAVILFCFLSAGESEAAANFTIRNYYGSNVVIQSSQVGSLVLPPGGMMSLPEYSGGDLGVLDGLGGASLGTISNHWQVGDANVTVNIGNDLITWAESETAMQSLYDGMTVGGALFAFAATIWVVSLMRPKDIGNPTSF